jgi:NAD(P)H-hydrate repair Nnr-like enzyme with NAD(P)H-hydrate epimerase domain
VLAKGQFGVDFCGGSIGKDKSKICIKPDCTVSSHKPCNGDSPLEDIASEDSVVCIEVPSSLPTKKGTTILPTAVFASPTLALSAIPSVTHSDILLEQK